MKKAVALSVAAGTGFEAEGTPRPAAKSPMPLCSIYRAVNGGPGENLRKVMELCGGIGRVIGPDDLVVIKPNVQWWNQGAPNIASLTAFVESIMERPGGFRGEVVIAENCHRGPKPWESASSGWLPEFGRNADLPGVRNYSGLCALFGNRYGKRFSAVHWVDVAAGAKRVYGPADGPGYVYCDGTGGVPLLACDNGLEGAGRRSTVMTYPVFVTGSGKVVDFKNGVWEKGAYTKQPMRFINFAALNHHSTYCGMTSSVKNYMGISDLSGGPDPSQGGRLTAGHYNFHSFPFNKWSPGPKAGMLGKAIGTFMRTVRKADLNIVTAEWVGLSSRTDAPVARTRTVLAGTDPVALDYHSARYLLHPNSGITFHDPDLVAGPLRQCLSACAAEYGGVLDEAQVAVESFDVASGRLQGEREMTVLGEKTWGTDLKAILKYVYLRYLSFLV